jgi:hypothetical protein
MRRAIALVVALAALTGAASAQARPLSMSEAERAARAAVAPASVENAVCERQPGTTGSVARRKAFCTLVLASTASGETCRTFVLVSAPKGRGSAQTSVLSSNVCLPTIQTIEV